MDGLRRGSPGCERGGNDSEDVETYDVGILSVLRFMT